ncbi:serine/threonine-protein phosphatase [Kovacikia minuta CCNUW1]|uniref:PP2C family protein-serine/threonine phosphatase n=1 Tax=Kovacikia minuta TaxID=2931930 RepID=UPI001CCF0747|nr:PP2C family serine/threonine-protein phosphatase [Kovacikia minuta]UBF26638.1 serine/threonine-protein phosphatase [Kovacikia minuta CCNUW1]
MSHSNPQICCPNPVCAAPLNALGNTVCESCKTPLIYRYLWAMGKGAEQIPASSQVGGRYYVTARRIWLDTQPSLPPDVPVDWSDEVMPYLYLYPHRLHLPEVYGFYLPEGDGAGENAIFLLENGPLDESGILFPAIAEAWSQATAVRQVYWLWQILQLWNPLQEQGVAASLLATDNLRVEGWRVRLCQLYQDTEVLAISDVENAAPAQLGLADLAYLWLGWAETAHPAVVESLRALCHQMQLEGSDLVAIANQLNELLIQQAAQLPLHLKVVGGTDTGPERSHNEDACYPLTLNQPTQVDGLIPRLAIVCDGIGGHEGGEVASQIAVQSLKPQVQALLAEVAEQEELVTPDLLIQQLEASVRVVNNLIASHNDLQGREERRRMGTTLVLALQLPQRVKARNEDVFNNGHELYLVNVGDSRAYWITQRYCHQLTLDDDVSVREVRMGRALYREALQRPDAGALTQAIGTRDSEFLHPTVQRFILEEDGLLLLCSDGVSDNGLVDRTWTEIARGIFSGKLSLEAAAKTWIDLANQHNGYDNSSVVLLRCQVSSPISELSLPKMDQPRGFESTNWAASSEALLTDTPPAVEQPEQPASPPPTQQPSKRLVTLFGFLLLLILLGTSGLFAWSQLDPNGFRQFRQKVLPTQSIGGNR